MITPTGMTVKEYCEAIDNGVTHIRMTFPVENIVLTDDDFESNGIQINDYMNSEEDLTFGMASSQEITAFIFKSNKTEALEWVNEFQLELGVEYQDSISWITVGYFTGKKPTKTDIDVITFTAYDRMVKFDVIADDLLQSLDYTQGLTLQDIYDELCSYVGITNVAGDEINANMNINFTSAPFFAEGITCRQILKWIAEAAGCYARILNTGEVKLVWFQHHVNDFLLKRDDCYEIDISEMKWWNGKTWAELESYTWQELEGLTWQELEGYSPLQINAVQVINTIGNVGVLEPDTALGINIYTIVDNPFLYYGDVTDIRNHAHNLFERLKDFGGYVPASVNCEGNWLIEPGDIIDFEYAENDTGHLPLFSRIIYWNGGCKCTYEATGNLERKPVSSDNREKLEIGGKFRIFRKNIDELYSEINDPQTGLATKFSQTDGQILATAISHKYTIQSGVDITADGVEISGGRWVKIKAGTGGQADGIFEVDTVNFKVQSENNLVQAGDWRMTDDGFAGLWKDSENYDRVISIRETIGSATMPDDLKERVGVFMYNLHSGSGINAGETFYITIARENDNQRISRPTVTIWRNGYFRFQTLRSPVYFWYYQKYGEMQQEWSVDTVFICNSLGAPDLANIIATAFIKNIYVQDIEPYTSNETGTGIYYPTQAVTAGHVGTQTHWFAYAYLYNIYYANLVQSSSREKKRDIALMNSVGDKMDQLTPVTFKYKNDPEQRIRHGLIYEDTVDIMPEICSETEGEKAINYVELIPMLLKEIQDLRKRVSYLESKLEDKERM